MLRSREVTQEDFDAVRRALDACDAREIALRYAEVCRQLKKHLAPHMSCQRKLARAIIRVIVASAAVCSCFSDEEMEIIHCIGRQEPRQI
jgi:alkylation response protein AidB-like acyl-CoA dehydrogenase